MTDAAQITAGLSRAQREAVIQQEAWSGHTRKALVDAGIAFVNAEIGGHYRATPYSSPRYPFGLTATGLAVREHLQRQASEGEVDQ